jgi:hypothetical protein
MDPSPSSASADATQERQEIHVVATQSQENPDNHDTIQDTKPSHENTTLLQPQNEAINQSENTANLIQSESTPAQNNEAPHVITPPLNPRRDSQEATVLDHGNASQSNPEAQGIDDNENGVQSGQHFPMPLDVSPKPPDATLTLSNAR